MTDLPLDFDLVQIPLPEASGEYVRDLEEADVKLLTHHRASPNDAPVKLGKRLSIRHHELARCLANGYENWRAAAFTGYDETYVSIMKADPTFWNLVLFYRENLDAKYENIENEKVGLTMDAMRFLRDKLEFDRDNVTFNQGLKAVEMGLDRTGHGPSMNHSHRHEHAIGMAERMQAAQRRVEGKVIDVMPTDDDKR